MMFPLTSTLEEGEREEPVPSKLRTFWNNVAPVAGRFANKPQARGVLLNPKTRLLRWTRT
jgi:hypothetical protein